MIHSNQSLWNVVLFCPCVASVLRRQDVAATFVVMKLFSVELRSGIELLFFLLCFQLCFPGFFGLLEHSFSIFCSLVHLIEFIFSFVTSPWPEEFSRARITSFHSARFDSFAEFSFCLRRRCIHT